MKLDLSTVRPDSHAGGARRRSATVLCGTLVLAALSACREAPPPPTVVAPRVLVGTVTSVDLEERIEVTGELQARLETTVAAKVGGEITIVAMEEGAPVDRGAVLFEIDPHRRKLELDAATASATQAAANLAQQQRSADRMRALVAKGVASTAQLDEAVLQYDLAKAQVAATGAQREIAQQALDDATVRAPFSGLTGRRHVSLGQFVQIGTPLVELVSLDPIDVVFHVAEIDSALVARGQTVDIRVAPYPDETFHAVVDVVFPTLDPQSRTQRVKATLANPDGRLRPGLFARADLGIAVRKGITVVPDEAVLLRSDGSFVFRLRDDGVVERRRVELGPFRDGKVEIRSGVTSGETVVTRGHMDLVDGARVEVVASPDVEQRS